MHNFIFLNLSLIERSILFPLCFDNLFSFHLTYIRISRLSSCTFFAVKLYLEVEHNTRPVRIVCKRQRAY